MIVVLDSHPMRAGRNQLFVSGKVHEQRRDEGFFQVAARGLNGRTLGTPDLLAGFLVQRVDVLRIAPVAHEQHQVFVEHHRTARADLMIKREAGAPDFLPGLRIQAGRAPRAEIAI